MAYDVKFGGMAGKIMDAAAELGDEAPFDESEVELWPPALPYYVAFQRLSGRRGYVSGMGGSFPMAIQYTEMSAYAKDMGYTDPADFEEFVALLAAMDAAYLKSDAEHRSSS